MVNTEEVQCIVEAMEEDFLKHPPRDEAAGVLPIRSVVTLYRAACDWLGREPKSVEVQRACVGYCPSEPVVDGFVAELGATVRSCIGYENFPCGVLVAGGVTRCTRCVREMASDNQTKVGREAPLGRPVIGEEIARSLNAGIEPTTGQGVMKPIRIDDLPEPTREECEADAKLHEEIVEKLGMPDPDEVRRALDEQRRKYGHVEPEILAAAGAYLRLCEQDRDRRPVPLSQSEAYEAGIADAGAWRAVAIAVGECMGLGLTTGYYTAGPAEWSARAMDRAAMANRHATSLAMLASYVSGDERFRGNVGRDAVDVVIEALRASGAQREASPQTQLVASDPKTVRIMVAAAVLNPLIVRFSHPGSISPGSRAVEARAALAWADSLIAEAEESLKPGPGRWNR